MEPEEFEIEVLNEYTLISPIQEGDVVDKNGIVVVTGKSPVRKGYIRYAEDSSLERGLAHYMHSPAYPEIEVNGKNYLVVPSSAIVAVIWRKD